MLRTATNMMSINTHRNLKIVSERGDKVSEKLASGKKINRAADDAAGLAISEKMKAQIRGLNQAQRNVEDGISLIQTAEGGMSEICEMIARQRELTIQAMNDTNTANDRQKIQTVIDQLTEEITATANQTEFNGIPLLSKPMEGAKLSGDISINATPPADIFFAIDISGSMGSALDFVRDTVKDFMDSIPGDIRIGFIIYSDHLTTSGEDMQSFELNGNSDEVLDFIRGINLKFGGDEPEAGLEAIHEAIGKLSSSAAGRERHIVLITDAHSHTKGTVEGAEYTIEETNQALLDNNIKFHAIFPPYASSAAKEQAEQIGENTGGTGNTELTFEGIQPGTNIASNTYSSKLWIQSGANEEQGVWIDRYDCRAKSLGIDPIIIDPIAEAEKSLAKLDNAVEYVTYYRANSGAQQNRLEHTNNYLGIASENLAKANSIIADTDMAKEMMEYTKFDILSQAGMAMLSQANQVPQNILSLLK